MPEELPPDQLEAAREALAGPERAARLRAEDEALAKERREAQIAMESPLQKARRLERERLAAEAAEAARLHAELEAKRAAEAAAAKKAELDQAAAAEAKRAAEWEAKITKAKQYETLIETVKGKSSAAVPALRTLTSDIARVGSKGLTIPTPAAERPAHHFHFGRLLVWLVILLLIIGSAGMIYYADWRTSPPPVPPDSSPRTALIFAETDVALPTTGGAAAVLPELRRELTALGTPGTITEVRLLEPTPEGQSAPTMKLGNFLAATGLPLPPGLAHFLGGDFMLGTYHSPTGSTPFFIFRVTSFDDAFGGMLRFEATVATDLYDFWGLDPTVLPAVENRGRFTDDVIQNIDTVRVLDRDGVPVFLYAFTNDRQTLIITTSTEAFRELVRRLATPLP